MAMEILGSAMTWWIKSILIVLISVFGLVGMDCSMTLAAPASQPAIAQSQDDDGSPALQIVPELTNPAEMPVVEVQPETMSPFLWLKGAVTDDGSSEDRGDSGNSVDATLEKWLSSVTTFFEGR